jgi:hypothetical protein
MACDDNISAIDISIYNALFLIWNKVEFDTLLSINRNDIMKLAKVGNQNTYTATLKRLHELGYIEYKPSKNPLIGSIVTLIRFDNSSDKSSDICSDDSCGVSGGDCGDTLYKPLKLNKPNKQLPKGNYDSNESLFADAYSKIEKTKMGIFDYLLTKPKEPQPYVDYWNLFAKEKIKPIVKVLNKSRSKKIITRLADPNFNFIAILKKATNSDILISSNWFAFDWIVENEKNYLKVLEGNYDNQKEKTETNEQQSEDFKTNWERSIEEAKLRNTGTS